MSVKPETPACLLVIVVFAWHFAQEYDDQAVAWHVAQTPPAPWWVLGKVCVTVNVAGFHAVVVWQVAQPDL